ncbi:7372_t:CDS:1 [Scutellospora calospora]|uniref:7372_t:CDS:1 n=1 Tax=Scutellospora calospora TaxID=85575 RepID=A0ACA9LKC4_9GLOM|nr:7372_t:CDS:1 [Scutellospora calospora]
MSEDRETLEPYTYRHDTGTFFHTSPEHVEEKSHDATRNIVRTVSEVSSKTSTKLGSVKIFQNPREILSPVLNGVHYLWDHFPPLSWFAYVAIVLNAIPLTVLLAFLIGTTAIVLFISGIGIFLAAGFFIGLGLLFLVPVVGVMLFAAVSTAFFTTFGYGSYRSFLFVLRNLGIIAGEVAADTRAAITGAKKAVVEELHGEEQNQ